MARRRKKKTKPAEDAPAADSAPATDEVVSPETEPAVDTEEKPESNETSEATDSNGDKVAKELSEYKDKYLRLAAEMDNFRKRKVKEIDDARRNSKIATIEEIMPVMDQFQMAVSAISSAADIETIKMGMQMIQTTFDRAFENLGMERVMGSGSPFDPQIHEAVSMEASDEVEADHVIREWKSGYRLGDFLIRPASVVVSSGPAQAEDDSTDEDERVEEEASVEE